MFEMCFFSDPKQGTEKETNEQSNLPTAETSVATTQIYVPRSGLNYEIFYYKL